MRPLRWWAESAPLPGWNRFEVSENLGVTAVIPVAPVVTSQSDPTTSNRKTAHDTELNIVKTQLCGLPMKCAL